MSRIALVPPTSELRAALVDHELADTGDVVVLDLLHAPCAPPDHRPCIAAGAAEDDRGSLETAADAFTLGRAGLASAIAYVLGEDRARRTTGPPRLTVIGSLADDHGAVYSISPAAPTLLGRSRPTAHPIRPDQIYTRSGRIARRHAEVRFAGATLAMRDLQSTNGTLIVRRGEPTRRICPTTYGAELPSTAWLVRDRTADWPDRRRADPPRLLAISRRRRRELAR